MFMKLRFSRGYTEYPAVQSIGVCCCSNTNSAEVLLEQQWTTAGPHADDTGGL